MIPQAKRPKWLKINENKRWGTRGDYGRYIILLKTNKIKNITRVSKFLNSLIFSQSY